MVAVERVFVSNIRAPRRMPTVRVACGAFRIPDPDDVKDTAPPAGTAAVDLGGMLALQEFEGESPRDRAARRHGQVILAALSGVQRALLTAGAGSDLLDRLVRLLESVPEPDDPRLRSVLEAVLLRAHVELAKQGR